jgi:carboxyl-terminal processing protease
MTTGGSLRITTARWFTPLGRSISPVVDTSLELDADVGPRRPTQDTARPRFTTTMGRTVLGGGGIVPDVFAGDSVPNVQLQALARALGVNGVQYRDALARVALRFKERKAFADPLQPVTREMVNAVWDELVLRNVSLPRDVFDAAAPWIARALGYESARVAFGPDAEFRRRAQDDAVIARALRLLDGVQSPREPFARADDPGILVPMRAPTLED